MRIAIYNLHFSSLGGGERSTALLAAHLRLAHEVTLYSGTPIDRQKILDLFGVDLHGLPIVVLPPQDHFAAIAEGAPDLFINNSFGSRLVCPAPRGIYMCMFPEGSGEGLESYQIITANSRFTATWIERLWSRRATVVYSSVESMGPPGGKENIILNVARFQADSGANHFKQQDFLLQAFADLVKGPGSGWEMHFVGTVGGQPNDQDFADNLCDRAVGWPVHFHFGLGQSALRDLYRRAALYWHATGFGADEIRQPSRQEHFGLTILEAMSAGAVPLAFRGGGPCETIAHGRTGFLWSCPAELMDFSLELMANSKRRIAISEQAVRASRRFDKRPFLERMDALVDQLLSSRTPAPVR